MRWPSISTQASQADDPVAVDEAVDTASWKYTNKQTPPAIISRPLAIYFYTMKSNCSTIILINYASREERELTRHRLWWTPRAFHIAVQAGRVGVVRMGCLPSVGCMAGRSRCGPTRCCGCRRACRRWRWAPPSDCSPSPGHSSESLESSTVWQLTTGDKADKQGRLLAITWTQQWEPWEQHSVTAHHRRQGRQTRQTARHHLDTAVSDLREPK